MVLHLQGYIKLSLIVGNGELIYTTKYIEMEAYRGDQSGDCSTKLNELNYFF